MNIDKILDELDSYFKNTPKEHFDNIWKDVRKYEAYGPDITEFLCKENTEKQDNAAGDTSHIHYGKLNSSAFYTFASTK